MYQSKSVFTVWSHNITFTIATLVLALAFPALLPAADVAGKVIGMSFVGRQVGNLDDAVKFYEALDFKLASPPGDWQIDAVANRLTGTPGLESRTAVMTMQSSVSDIPMNFILREYRGIERRNWSSLSSSDLLSGHMDLTVLEDCNPWMDKLKAINMLKVPQMNIRGGGEDGGPRRFVFVQDPDGWYVELFALMSPKPGDPPAGPKVSNSTATFENIDRWGVQAGFNHLGLNVLDMVKALSLYQGVLGGDYPPYTPPAPPKEGEAPRMAMMNGWFPQARTASAPNLRFELIGFPQNQGKQPPAMNFTDIGVTLTAFEVTGLDDLYARAVAVGAKTVSEGGIVQVPDGRAVILRDPDVGGFVELWEPTK
jgi:hypothetical protein